jgi:hypothetical protein
VLTPELQRASTRDEMWRSLADLDAYRRRFDETPASLTNAVLLGALLVPLGLMPKRGSEADDGEADDRDLDEAEPGNRNAAADDPQGDDHREEPAARGRRRRYRAPKPPVLKVGTLPIARRDSERLRQILSLQRRMADLHSSPRARRALMYRGPFDVAMTWMDIHGHVPEIVEHWRGFIEAVEAEGHARRAAEAGGQEATPPYEGERRRRRRRRGGRRFRGRER